MAEEKQSMLYKLKPLVDRLPAVSRPEGHVHFRTKMMWVLLVLILYFALTNIMIYGLDQDKTVDLFAGYRAIMAGATGSLMHLGIGPIVTGSIIMQLFTGAKIINLDLSKDEDKAVYQGTQKLLVIIMIVVESIPQVYGYLVPSSTFINNMDGFWMGNGPLLARTLIILQLCIGSYMVFLFDEIVSKWGIGSGVSLFIAAGVSQAIFTGTFNWAPVQIGTPLSISNPPAGTIPKTFYLINSMSSADLVGGGYERIFLQAPNPIIALIGTTAIFLFVAYAESCRVELPLAHDRARGARGRYPIRLIYASNIPVILMSALLANVSMLSLLLWSHPTLSKWPLIGHQGWIGAYPSPDYAQRMQIRQSTPISGIAYYTSTIKGVGDWLLPLMDPSRYGTYMHGHTYLQVLAHLFIYVGVMVIGSILFAKFWIETVNMGPDAVAKQIHDSGMHIPGFRRDPRVLRKILARYIPVVTIISGMVVGGLAAGADLIGTVGNTSGTGVLLAVGIMIQMYEAIGREQMMEMHPVLRGFFGS